MRAKSQSLKMVLSARAWQYIRQPSMRHKIKLKTKQRRFAKEYVKTQDKLLDLEPIASFRNELVKKYLGFHKGTPHSPELENEATRIALTLFKRTFVLKDEFKMNFIPSLHNFLYDVGLKPAGECYHWAEGLLEQVKPMPREFFLVTWAHSKPKTNAEHNVTVIFPREASFDDGLLFDPWRTGGKPFWRSPKIDPHFKWKKWDDYGIY